MTFDQPEAFFTINYIPGFFIEKIPLTIMIGTVFVLCFLFFYFFKTKKKNNFFIFLILVFWMPVYAIYFYNNFYDIAENLKIIKRENSVKRILRICNMERYYSNSSAYCRIFSFVDIMGSALPYGTEVKLLTSPYLSPYVQYYLYPYLKFNDNSKYILLYYSNKHYYEDGSVYNLDNGEKEKCNIIASMHGGLLLEKKID